MRWPSLVQASLLMYPPSRRRAADNAGCWQDAFCEAPPSRVDVFIQLYNHVLHCRVIS